MLREIFGGRFRRKHRRPGRTTGQSGSRKVSYKDTNYNRHKFETPWEMERVQWLAQKCTYIYPRRSHLTVGGLWAESVRKRMDSDLSEESIDRMSQL